MIRLGRRLLRAIETHAREAWPEEACGLLIGAASGDGVEITGIERTANVAGDRRRRFEIDPVRHLELQRVLRGAGRAVVGVYHSHPGGSAEPSETDRDEALDPDLVWLIVGLDHGQIIEINSYRVLAGGRSFAKVPMTIEESA